MWVADIADLILDISKIEARKIELYPEDFHFLHLLWRINPMCQIRSQKKGITFNYQHTTLVPTVIHVAQKRLRQGLITFLFQPLEKKYVNFAQTLKLLSQEFQTQKTINLVKSLINTS